MTCSGLILLEVCYGKLWHRTTVTARGDKLARRSRWFMGFSYLTVKLLRTCTDTLAYLAFDAACKSKEMRETKDNHSSL